MVTGLGLIQMMTRQKSLILTYTNALCHIVGARSNKTAAAVRYSFMMIQTAINNVIHQDMVTNICA